jgi:hypothetical protein
LILIISNTWPPRPQEKIIQVYIFLPDWFSFRAEYSTVYKFACLYIQIE